MGRQADEHGHSSKRAQADRPGSPVASPESPVIMIVLGVTVSRIAVLSTVVPRTTVFNTISPHRCVRDAPTTSRVQIRMDELESRRQDML